MITENLEWCIKYIDELNSEAQAVFDSDIYHRLGNAQIELDELKKKATSDSHADKIMAKQLIKYDVGKECTLHCGKVDWGEDKHIGDCPFAMAYKILGMA